MSETKILLADDQAMVRHNLRRILESQEDLRVVGEVADGDSAIEQARLLRPDVVLADIRMPGRDGLAVTRELAGPGVRDPVRVVVITTFDLDEYVYTALRNGACGFLLKRAGAPLLIEGVRAAVAGDMLISPQLTLQLLRHLAPRHVVRGVVPPLTERELEVARLVAEARTNGEIAEQLCISAGTVKTHLVNIQRKLNTRNRVAIAAWVWETIDHAT